jgi:predicted nucleic acid-binding protein
MARLIESSLWVDFTRRKSPVALKASLQPWILDPEACLCEPVAFDILRHATPEERPQLEAQFATLPILTTPPRLWREATRLGQICREQGHTAGSLDLLIAALTIHHGAELVTFDADYEPIARHSELNLRLLTRPEISPA